MLSVASVASAGGAANYFAKDDYYVGDGPAELSEWGGKGAEALGLAGPVAKDDFEKVLDGKLPDDTVVNGNANRRSGIDLTFSMPKSASLLAQPGAVTLAPRSILPALGPGGSAHGVGVLDMALDPAALALAPLGVAYPRQAMPALLREMLAPCGDAGLVAGPDGLVACG